jgi:hypothetical protein
VLPDLSRINPARYKDLPDRMSVEQQHQFLDLLCNGSSQIDAVRSMNIPMLLVWRERHANPEFDDFMHYVIENARPQALEEIAVSFATQGVEWRREARSEKPVLVDGKPVEGLSGEQLTTVETSVQMGHEYGPHTLLQFLLKGQQRAKYGTEHKQIEANVNTTPPAVRKDEDAKRLLARMREELRPVIEGEIVNNDDDGSDLV